MNRLIKRENGFTFIEVMISMVIVSTLAVGVLTALGTTSLTLLNTDLAETAKNLAESQMEYIKNLPYSGSYSPYTVPPEYGDLTAAINSTALLASNIEKITVTINQGSKVLYVLEGYKVQ